MKTEQAQSDKRAERTDSPSGPASSGPRVQLKQELMGLSYEEQVQAVRPAPRFGIEPAPDKPPVQTSVAGRSDALVQCSAGNAQVQFETGPDTETASEEVPIMDNLDGQFRFVLDAGEYERMFIDAIGAAVDDLFENPQNLQAFIQQSELPARNVQDAEFFLSRGLEVLLQEGILEGIRDDIRTRAEMGAGQVADLDDLVFDNTVGYSALPGTVVGGVQCFTTFATENLVLHTSLRATQRGGVTVVESVNPFRPSTPSIGGAAKMGGLLTFVGVTAYHVGGAAISDEQDFDLREYALDVAYEVPKGAAASAVGALIGGAIGGPLGVAVGIAVASGVCMAIDVIAQGVTDLIHILSQPGGAGSLIAALAAPGLTITRASQRDTANQNALMNHDDPVSRQMQATFAAQYIAWRMTQDG